MSLQEHLLAEMIRNAALRAPSDLVRQSEEWIRTDGARVSPHLGGRDTGRQAGVALGDLVHAGDRCLGPGRCPRRSRCTRRCGAHRAVQPGGPPGACHLHGRGDVRRAGPRPARCLDPVRAATAVAQIHTVRTIQYPFEPLGGRVWRLRDSITVYDAWYVALAEWLSTDLVTQTSDCCGRPDPAVECGPPVEPRDACVDAGFRMHRCCWAPEDVGGSDGYEALL